MLNEITDYHKKKDVYILEPLCMEYVPFMDPAFILLFADMKLTVTFCVYSCQFVYSF